MDLSHTTKQGLARRQNLRLDPRRPRIDLG